MKVYNTLLTNMNQFTAWLREKDLNHENQCIVTIHTGSLTETECLELAKLIKELLPHAQVHGYPVSGVIYNGDIFEKETLVSIREFEYGKVLSVVGSTKDLSSLEVATSIAQHSENFPTSFALLNFDLTRNDLIDVSNFLTKMLPDTYFVGGVVGNMLPDGEIDSFIFDDKKIYRNCYLVSYISNDHVLSYSDSIVGHPPISEAFTITKAHDEYIDEINDVPAVEWFCDKLGLEKFYENKDWKTTVPLDILLRFPLVFDGYSASTCFIRYEKETHSIRSYFTNINSGQKFRMGYISPIKSAEELQETCQSLQKISAEMIFCYTCLFRNVLSNNIAKWEIGAFKKNKICGVFMLGEIGTVTNHVQLHNGSVIFFTLAEKAETIEPDLSVFDSMDSLLEANSDFIHTLKNIGENLKSDIFTSLIEKEEEIKARFYSNNEDGFQTIPQFMKRQRVNKKQQICLVSIENFPEFQTLLTEDDLLAFTRENRKHIINFVEKTYPQYRFDFYRYDDSCFFFTVQEKVSDTIFTEVVREIYTHCGRRNFTDSKLVFFNNFTFTLKGLIIQQLLDCSQSNTLSKDQKRFYHCDKETSDSTILNEEFQMVAALHEIIEKNSIVPYFQGIYDNKKNRFHMYEALMRLQHPDGRMLFPNDFMEIAKKYNLYLSLSLGMVTKVFELFKDRHEIITLNISAYDVLSEKFRDTIFELLQDAKNPDNFVFELLETEAFDDLATLRAFIHKVRQYGCKFAVDDFGAGYSNFIEFGNLDVDYLKINGSLTKLLGTDFNYSHILNSIAFMGEKMRVKLIAEFVETASTQKLLIQSGVHYSQGYFFSKPMPYSELKVVSAENMAKEESQAEENDSITSISNKQIQTKSESLFLQLGGMLVALLSVISVIFFVDYNKSEFKKINDAFLVEIATGLSDKISLFAEESKISLNIMACAVSEYAEMLIKTESATTPFNVALLNELLLLDDATKFDATYISYLGGPAIDGEGQVLDIDIDTIYGHNRNETVAKLPIAEDSKGNKILVFAANFYINGLKSGEIYGTYKVDDISKLLKLKSFGGEAFYHISQVDGEPVYLSGRNENAFTNGDMYDFIGSLDIFNGHTSESVRKDMENGKTVLLNYKLKGEERSAVMVRVPDTNWCVVSIVLSQISREMFEVSNRSTFAFIGVIAALFIFYFSFAANIFKKHRNIILETLESSQSLSNSLQLSIEKDSLTGTYSRATAIEKISSIIASKSQKGEVHALSILDIDNFKYINDTYGHNTGDLYLQSFVSAVKLGIQPGSVLGRLGGDEFVLLLSDIQSKENVCASFDKVFTNIKDIVLGGVDLGRVSVSAGIVMISENDRSYEELMIEADSILYEAKRKGKNKYLFSVQEG